MLERSRSGAYIPVGMSQKRQMDATSPWAVGLAATAKGEQVCPDCAAERAIRRREGAAEAAAEKRTASTRPAQQQLVVTRDMPECIGAIIFEHAGRLDRVVTNARRGPSVPELLSIIDQVAKDLRLNIHGKG